MSQLNAIATITLFASFSLLSTVSFDSSQQFGVEIGAVANAAQPYPLQWSPERGRGSVGGTLSGGRRGTEATCQAEAGPSNPSITLLVPGDSQGLLTTSMTPQFHWFVETPAPVEMTFVLQHPHQATPVYQQKIQAAHSGLVSVSLPRTQAIAAGTPYRWSVLLTCAPNQTTEVVARSFIERVERADLIQKTPDRPALEQAAIFASAGIWYDAVSQLVTAYLKTPQDAEIKAGLKSLLQQAGSEQARQRLTLLSNTL